MRHYRLFAPVAVQRDRAAQLLIGDWRKYVFLPGETKLPPMGIDDLTLGHMANWFECMRSRQQPHCTVREGFAHSVAWMIAAEAYWSGRKQYWDAATETFSDRVPADAASAL